MKYLRILSLCVTVMALIGAVLLGLGADDPSRPLAAVIVACTSWYFTDLKGWIRLNATLTNLAGLLVLLVALVRWDNQRPEEQLASMANLLIDLELIMLFREKSIRNLWLLIVLSFLQVAVSTALHNGMWFGLVMLGYLLVALFTVTLFLLYREQLAVAASLLREGAPDDWRRPVQPRQLLGPPPLAAVVQRTGRLGAWCFLWAALVFLALPRVGQPANWTLGQTSPSGVRRSVGFTQRVTLGALGEVVENSDEVLRVRLSDSATGEPYELYNELYLRGTVLATYLHGQWNAPTTNESPIRLVEEAQPDSARPLVRMSFELEPLSAEVAFSVAPSWNVGREPLGYDRLRDQYFRLPQSGMGLLRYELLSGGFTNHVQRDVTPHVYPRRPWLRLSGLDHGTYLALNRQSLPEIGRLAEEIVAALPPEQRPSRLAQARALERYLQHEGGFEYSLQGVARDSGRDPIEDFLFVHRQGHCEYFASALTLLLRAVGIPARLIVGFKGGEWNSAGGYYEFRQLHAHTWVEAYLENTDLPAEAFDVAGQRPNHGWLRLDPTPAAAEEDSALGLTTSLIQRVDDYSTYLWSQYIVGLTPQRQRDSIYGPLVKRAKTAYQQLADGVWWKQATEPGGLLSAARWGVGPGRWFSWQLAAALAAALLGGWFCWQPLPRLLRWLGLKWKIWRLTQAKRGPGLPIYRRLLELLAAQGLTPTPTQTPREFARAASQVLAREPRTAAAAHVPPFVVEAYYALRYGRRRLDNAERATLEHALRLLAAAR